MPQPPSKQKAAPKSARANTTIQQRSGRTVQPVKLTFEASDKLTPRAKAREPAPRSVRAGTDARLYISIGCPAGIGPEVSLKAALALNASKPKQRAGGPAAHATPVLVGDWETLTEAARLLGVGEQCLAPYAASEPPLSAPPGCVFVHDPGVRVSVRDRLPGRPSRRSGAAQLAWVEAAYGLCREPGAAMVTGPVSKAAIAHSGVPGAESFLGHTEWLQALDGAPSSVMCFTCEKLTTSLVTTHLPLAEVSENIRTDSVKNAIVALAELLLARGLTAPTLAVCSLNPHAGESELLGDEEQTAILPGMRAARRLLPTSLKLVGPIGAETAFRKAVKGDYAGVVAMYHDQATIPMKLLAFGEAVNVTSGLRVVRTSVDHGTGYDIAWQGVADASGMLEALKCAERLLAYRSRTGKLTGKRIQAHPSRPAAR